MGELDARGIALASDVVRTELTVRLRGASTGRPGQPLASEIFELVVSQSLIPILVAVTSTRLGDVLKDRRLKRLSRAEAERTAEDLAGSEIGPDPDPDPEALAQLRSLLAPLGLAAPDVEALVELVRQTLAGRGGAGPD